MADEIRGAVIGYGAAFNMGRHHAHAMNNQDGMKTVAILDIDKARTDAAQKDFADIETFNSLDDMLAWGEFDVAVNVLPHNLHHPVTLPCLQAGKHAIVEKPFTITIAEATELIETAKKKEVVLTVHHNRRWDADFWTLKNLVASGIIGQVYNVEMWGGGYGRPNPNWWRSVKAVSGGAFYDWGAHFIDWLLNVIPEKMINITGFFHDLVWHDISNEDHVHGIIRFANGCSADIQMSNIAKVGKPRWRLLGSHGSIVSDGGKYKILSEVEGFDKESEVGFSGRPGPSFYTNFVAHVNDPENNPLIVTPESARRVIAVLELSEKSAHSHQSETAPYEFEE
ncbi:MAG: Gfo/Idh/MocA family oxidoreductase [Candidatus Poribacteria bacterium]|nr:Gfo/Idh/MocA family oxidoreductase [Candidatus Poribacteria bacterium]